MTEELKKLIQLVDDFAIAMKARLIEKMNQDWHGWDGHCIRDETLHSSLLVNYFEQHYIDVANFAAFLWHRSGREGR